MKKYIIKSLCVCAISLFAFTQTGCNDLLDQQPQGEWVKGDGTAGSFQTDIFTLYAKMRGFNVSSGTPAFAIHSFRSEDAEKGSTLNDGTPHEAMFDNFNYTASNGLIGSYWTDNYAIIHGANNVIKGIKDMEDSGTVLTDGDKINRSEAHFFRAFAYFNLVRAFGEVPFIDFTITNAEQANVPKASKDKIYTLIDADLTAAEEFLPTEWQPLYIGRLTWGAARSLHAKAYLTRNDWANAYTAATEVINSHIYNLDTPYDKIFRETGENTSESVLELQCTATPALPGSNEIGSQFAQVQGVRGSGQWNLGWGWNTPTQLLADAFEPNDPRKDETLLYFHKSDADAETIANTPINKPFNERPIANADVINKYYNKKAYTNPATRAIYNLSGFWYNIRLIRYSDVVLMAAEAANESGRSGEAVTYLEMVRNRARGGNAAILPKVDTNDQALLRTAIRHERRVELGMEFDRFYDLVRWGIAADVLHAAGKTNYQARHALLPIPQTEIDKSNGVLIQNPNY